MEQQKTCAERIDGMLEGTIEELRQVWEAYCNGEDTPEDLTSFEEYGLSFDYVPEGTFSDQERGYFRYQLSWGGPSDEFRFYVGYDQNPYYIEYAFLDWWDGATKELIGSDFELLKEIFEFFKEIGSVDSEFENAQD